MHYIYFPSCWISRVASYKVYKETTPRMVDWHKTRLCASSLPQWNPVNVVTNGSWKFCHINRVAVLWGTIKFPDWSLVILSDILADWSQSFCSLISLQNALKVWSVHTMLTRKINIKLFWLAVYLFLQSFP